MRRRREINETHNYCRYSSIIVEQYVNICPSGEDDTETIQNAILLIDKGLGDKKTTIRKKWKWPWRKPTVNEILIIEEGGAINFEPGGYTVTQTIDILSE